MSEDSRKGILVFGEVLMDLFQEAIRRKTGSCRVKYTGVLGGAPCNVATNLTKCGSEVFFIGAFGDDPPGYEFYEMLIRRGVNLDYSVCPEMSKTALAVVYSNGKEDNAFRIYLSGSAFEQIGEGFLDLDVLNRVHWFHFGSVLMSLVQGKRLTERLVKCSIENDVVISYDINIRPNVVKNSSDTRPLIDIVRSVDILKISDEDFSWIRQQSGASDLRDPGDLLSYGCKLIAWTHGSKGATLLTKDHEICVSPSDSIVEDTTGAGDAFMAGLIHFLSTDGTRNRAALQEVVKSKPGLLEDAGRFASSLAGQVISQTGAVLES